MSTIELDALVVGAGFAGVYQLYSLRRLGLRAEAIERGAGVGGVWYWNTYPGVMTDSESHLYRYSWDEDDLRTYPWSHNYLAGDEVARYLNHVVDRHALRPHLRLSTALVSAEWVAPLGRWRVRASTGDTYLATYLFAALGIQSTPNVPALPGAGAGGGAGRFRGAVMHTAAWDHGVAVDGRRVGVVGCGSSGIQVAGALAPRAAALRCFVRHPQFSVPLRRRPATAAARAALDARWDEVWAAARRSATAFGFDEPSASALDVPPAARRRAFEDLWARGNGFRFMYGGFGDLASSAAANEEACRFLRGKIRSVVRDPAKAAVLTPDELFARRPACDEGYYEMFNQEHVIPVDINKNPIVAVEEDGIRTQDGRLHELDVIVLATGFQSGDGSYLAVEKGIRGRDGALLSDHWAGGIRTYLSMFVPSFPNLFMVNGPQGPFSNAPTLIEAEVDFLTDLLRERGGSDYRQVIECTPEAEDAWVRLCDDLAASKTLFHKVDSWLTSGNVAGAKTSTKFYYGGLKAFRDHLQEVREDGYHGLAFS